MLPEAYGHLYDPGQRLHPELPLLRRDLREASAAGPGGAGKCGRRRQTVGAAARGADLPHKGRSARRRRRTVCGVHPLDVVLDARPDVLNHNVETVRELQREVRPQADYRRSLDVLRYCREKGGSLLTKTGFMVGLGETEEQIEALMDDVLDVGVDILTIGQYLQPSPAHYPLARYASPEDFERYKAAALAKGFRYVASAPLARSSYKAWEALESIHDLH